MRLWSIHPMYLDRMGLLAVWREGLLAQKVLLGKTVGYRYHPQLVRFRNTKNPVGAIAYYLKMIAHEAECRNYRFDTGKLSVVRFRGSLSVTSGQVAYEFSHLLKKLEKRDTPRFAELKNRRKILLHPLFHEISGVVESWEKTE